MHFFAVSTSVFSIVEVYNAKRVSRAKLEQKNDDNANKTGPEKKKKRKMSIIDDFIEPTATEEEKEAGALRWMRNEMAKSSIKLQKQNVELFDKLTFIHVCYIYIFYS